MDNLKLSDAAREQLEEATVAVFMEQYAKALDAGIDKRIEECEGEEFPPELEKRCRALIEKESAKSKNEKRRKGVMLILQRAAVVVVALLSLSSILFMTVEAFRLPVMNFFIEKTDRYWQMTANPDENAVPATYDTENPLDSIIADSFVLTSLSGSVESGDLMAEYRDGDNSSVSCLQTFLLEIYKLMVRMLWLPIPRLLVMMHAYMLKGILFGWRGWTKMYPAHSAFVRSMFQKKR